MRFGALSNHTSIIFLSYLSLSIIAFLIYPLTEHISYIQQIKEHFLFLVYIGPLCAMFLDILVFPANIYSMILLMGNIVPVILIYKHKKLLPCLIIALVFYGVYLFLGIIVFGIRYGE